jgi:hypothetical protein
VLFGSSAKAFFVVARFLGQVQVFGHDAAQPEFGEDEQFGAL